MSGEPGAAFTTWLAALRPQVDATLERLLPAAAQWPGRLHAAMRYSAMAPGKRIRPALVVLAGEALGAHRDPLLGPAAALELLHAYSLVHDDLPALDDDDLRRGRATLHRQFDEATAILAGDALLTLGLTLLAREPASAAAETRRRAVELVGTAIGTGGMIGGQVEDLEAEAAWPQDPQAALERIHRGKTGALLVAALRLGGLHGGASPPVDERLRELGERLGLMFQIADDILDVEASTEQLGKSAGKDAAAQKLTYAGLYGVDESRARLAALRDEATAILAGDALLTLGLLQLAREPAAAPAEARRQAVELVGTAISTAGMIGGQMEDLAAERDWPPSPAAALERIHRGKTGALLTAALRLGSVLAGADGAADARLTGLGERLGMMFQIADDILDVEGTAEQLGKRAGKDAAARKLTFPGLYGVEESRRRLAALRDEALALAAALPGEPELWRGLVEYLARREA